MTRRVSRPRAKSLGGWRWRLIELSPTVLIDHAFELLIGAIGGIFGIAQLTGFSTNVLSAMLPPLLVTVTSGALVLASATIYFGLARRRYGTIVPLGLTLLAFTCSSYAVALFALVGPRRALFTILFLLAATLLSGLQSIKLQVAYALIRAEWKRADR